MAFCLELVQHCKLDFFRVSFMLAGHTKFSVDQKLPTLFVAVMFLPPLSWVMLLVCMEMLLSTMVNQFLTGEMSQLKSIQHSQGLRILSLCATLGREMQLSRLVNFASMHLATTLLMLPYNLYQGAYPLWLLSDTSDIQESWSHQEDFF